MIYQLTCLPDESIIFAATEIGPYAYSFDYGSWVSISGDDAPDQVYWSVEYIDEINTVRYGTYGRGIWDYKFDYDPTLSLGDLNQDDSIDQEDMVLLISLLMSVGIVSEEILNLGNIDHDERVSIIDLLLLIDIL